jgi:hypothetical protein
MRPFRHAFAAAVIVLALPAAAAAEQPARQLTMTGLGEVRDVPDMATISTGVVTEAETAARALAANTRAMAEAVASLKALGIEARDLQTSNFTVSPRYFHDPKSNRPPRITGYTVSNMLTVVVRDLDRLGAILDRVVRDGANQIGGPTFGFAETARLVDVARARAAADATRKARLYAEALGVELGPILSISEDGGFVPRPEPMRARMAMDSAAGAPPPIEGGELTLSARVNVVWEIR